jgi:hypothetical protein
MQRFTIVPILLHYDLRLPSIIEKNVSDFAIGTVLSQKEESVQPVAFYFRKMIAIELNYNIYIKEILVIISVFKE